MMQVMEGITSLGWCHMMGRRIFIEQGAYRNDTDALTPPQLFLVEVNFWVDMPCHKHDTHQRCYLSSGQRADHGL